MNMSLPLMAESELTQCVPDRAAGFGAMETSRGRLPLKSLDVQATIDGLQAAVDVRQTFVNAHDEPLEATYIFPLPDRAAVSGFRMEVAGRVVEAELRERGQAREEYARAIEAGHRAAIAEEDRPDVFTLRVGNLMPGELATIHLRLDQPLAVSRSEVTFWFPLVVAPRYIPGVPLPGPSVGSGTAADSDAVPDASRITPPVLLPGFPNPVQLSLACEIRPGALRVGDLRSSLHAVLADEQTNGTFRVAMKPGERPDRDFVLRFRVGADDVQTSLAVTPDPNDAAAGTFTLTIVPPVPAAAAQRPRDIVFVLDRSGSMRGWKMVAARRAVARMVDTLNDADRFAVYAFDDTIETPPHAAGGALVVATNRNRFCAVEFLAKVEARGGTEMAQPLLQAVRELAAAADGRDRILVLATDGQVGNEDQILRHIEPYVSQIRVFALGIDRAVNRGLLGRLAALGGGSFEIVESEDRLDEVMAHMHERLGTPVLTCLRLEPAGWTIEPESVVPSRLPALFAGVPLAIQGRCRGPAAGELTVHGSDASGQPWSCAVPVRTVGNSTAARLWARSRLRELEDRFAIGRGERQTLERQIVAMSLRFGVLCRFTAFVAVDKSEVANPGGGTREIVQPVQAPSEWEMFEPRAMGVAPLASAAAPGVMRLSRMAPQALAAEAYSELFSVATMTTPPAARLARQAPDSAAPPRRQKSFDDPRDWLRWWEARLSRAAAVTTTRYGDRAAHLLKPLNVFLAEPPARQRGALQALQAQLLELLRAMEQDNAAQDLIHALRDLCDAIVVAAGSDVIAAEQVAAIGTAVGHFVTKLVNDPTSPDQRRKAFWK